MNLTSLDINYNIKIDKLPESIGNLKYLSSFYASETSITELPYSILDTGIMRPIGYDMFRESLRPQGIIAPAHYFETKYPTYANLFHQLSLPDAVTKNISHYQSLGNCYKLLYATVPFEEIDKHITIFWNRRFQQFAENKEESRLLIEDIKIDTLNVDWSILTNSSITHLCLDSCIKEHLPKEIGLLFDAGGFFRSRHYLRPNVSPQLICSPSFGESFERLQRRSFGCRLGCIGDLRQRSFLRQRHSSSLFFGQICPWFFKRIFF